MKKFLALSSVLMITSSCAIAPAKTGFSLFSDVKEPVLISSNISGSKEGRACAENFLAVYSHGDMSVAKAAKNGGITKISSIDQEVKNRWVANQVCTIVRGE